MPEYLHGITLHELTEGVRNIRDVKTAVIGFVATAEDADPEAFPLDRPVLIPGDASVLAKAGTQGTLAPTLDAIFDQGAPTIVVVRVAEGADAAETITHVIGGSVDGRFTGLQALLDAKVQLGVMPRILGAPGLDTLEVATELVALADKLRAMCYLRAVGETPEAAVLYRDNFASRRVMLIWPDFIGWDSQTNQAVTLEATARALGLRAKIDHETGWHKTLSNVAVNGVSGLSKSVLFDLRSPDTTANYLNAAEITTLVNEDGYRFWGSRTCSDDPTYAFESTVRTGDFLGDTIADAHLWAIDKPMNRVLVFDLVEGINAKLRELKSLGRIVDGRAWLREDVNTITTLKDGQLHIDYDYVAIPPLEQLHLYQRINDTYLLQLVSGQTE